VRFIYPSSRLGVGVGNVAVVVAVSSAGSPTVAAAILSVASWRWLFLINVPIAGVDGLSQKQSVAIPVGELIAAAAFGVVFVRKQLRQAAPLLPVDLLKR